MKGMKKANRKNEAGEAGEENEKELFILFTGLTSFILLNAFLHSLYQLHDHRLRVFALPRAGFFARAGAVDFFLAPAVG